MPGIPDRLNATLADGERVGNLDSWSPDGRYAVARIFSDQPRAGRIELVEFDGSEFSSSTRVSAQNHVVTDVRFLAAGF